MLNLVRFYTTAEFYCEYLRNGSRRKSEKYVMNYNHSHDGGIGELWSTNKKL